MFITSTIIPKRSYLLKNLRCFSSVATNFAQPCRSAGLRDSSDLRKYQNPIIKHTKLLNHHGMTRLFSTTSVNNNNNEDYRQNFPQPRPSSRKLPALMDFPEIVWPSILKTIKNFILVNFIIRPYFDKDFALQDFIDGSKQALTMISNSISSGTNMDELQGLVTRDAINEIKASVSRMSMAQRGEISVDKEDVYFCFPYQIGIMFDESGSVQKRWVEITMVYHVLRGARELAERNEPVSFSVTQDPAHQERFSICNYRFIKEFTKEQQSDWVVNVVNHFKPIDKARSYQM